MKKRMSAFVGTVRRIVRLVDVFHAANCALWLLERKELKPLIDGEWGDPEAIRDMLRKAGCVPKCGREWALKPNTPRSGAERPSGANVGNSGGEKWT